MDTIFVVTIILFHTFFRDTLNQLMAKIRKGVSGSLTIDPGNKSILYWNGDKCTNLQLTAWGMFHIDP